MNKKITPALYLSKATYKNTIEDFCANYYYLFLSNKDDKEKVIDDFIGLLTWNRMSDQSLAIERKFSEDEYKTAENSVWQIVETILDNLISENYEESKFYQELYEKIFDDVLFSTDLYKISAITYLVLTPRVPYFLLPEALKMDNDTYSKLSASISRQFMKAIFVMYYGYKQSTELASQFYRIAKEIENEDEKIVFISQLISFFFRQMKASQEETDFEETEKIEE